MEIELDVPMLRKTISDEYQTSCREIAQLGPLPAYRNSLLRHDERLAAAPDAATLACRAGCSWCCYFSVEVRAVEAFAILEFVEREFSAEERQRVRREIESNAAELHSLSEAERVRRNLKCPFLSKGRCTIYTARPQTCRNYHATNVAGCEKSFNEPDNIDIDPDFAPLTYQLGGAHVDAFSQAMQDAGYDVRAYELSTALRSAMKDLQLARANFTAKRQTFADLAGHDVEPQFAEPEDFPLAT